MCPHWHTETPSKTCPTPPPHLVPAPPINSNDNDVFGLTRGLPGCPLRPPTGRCLSDDKELKRSQRPSQGPRRQPNDLLPVSQRHSSLCHYQPRSVQQLIHPLQNKGTGEGCAFRNKTRAGTRAKVRITSYSGVPTFGPWSGGGEDGWNQVNNISHPIRPPLDSRCECFIHSVITLHPRPAGRLMDPIGLVHHASQCIMRFFAGDNTFSEDSREL